MAFQYKNSRGTTYYLHGRTTRSETTGKERTLYFFSKDPEGGIDRVPDGYEVSESATGLPVLKRAGGGK